MGEARLLRNFLWIVYIVLDVLSIYGNKTNKMTGFAVFAAAFLLKRENFCNILPVCAVLYGEGKHKPAAPGHKNRHKNRKFGKMPVNAHQIWRKMPAARPGRNNSDTIRAYTGVYPTKQMHPQPNARRKRGDSLSCPNAQRGR